MSFMSMIGPDVTFTDPSTNKEYKLAPIGFKEYAEYVLWYQFKEFYDAKLLTRDLVSELRKSILEEAFKKCREKCYEFEGKKYPLSWETPEVQQSITTPEGIGYTLYLSLRVNHPEITQNDVSRIIPVVSYSELLDQINLVNGLAPEKTDEEPEPLGETSPNQ